MAFQTIWEPKCLDEGRHSQKLENQISFFLLAWDQRMCLAELDPRMTPNLPNFDPLQTFPFACELLWDLLK